MLQRKLQHLASMLAISAVAAAGLTLGNTKPVLAEFQIQEADIEKGEVELEYRGAYHWGVPQVTDNNENANDTVQSHELELQYSPTNWWLMQFTVGFDQPLGEALQSSDVEIETEFALIKREGDGVALSLQGGYQKALNGDADEIGFGPIVELARGKLLITLNPLFTDQVGPNRDTDGLGFEYGWRAEYDFAKHWGVGAEMFGQIEDLANAGTFNQQNHSIGPTLFYKPRGDGEEGKGGNDEKAAGPPEMELSLNVGLQFGLTDATSDTALKFQGSLSF
jgi:hypothetical protein